MRSVRLILCLLLPLVFAGLAGAASVVETLDNLAEPTADGFIREDGATDNSGVLFKVGSNAAGQRQRGYVSFNHTIGATAIPGGVRINTAVLSIFQEGCDNAPYFNLGPMRVDLMDYGAPPLTSTADTLTPLLTNLGDIARTCTTAPEAKSLVVTNAVQSIIDTPSIPRIQFRLRHRDETDIPPNGFADRDDITATEGAVAVQRPRLAVNYSPVRTLTVNLLGTGTGLVTAPPDGNGDGISCLADCTGQYFDGAFDGALVTLTATETAPSLLTGWSGCVDNPTPLTCRVNMDGDQTVTAQFDLPTHALTVSLAGSGTGTVTAAADVNGDGISCLPDCSGTYTQGGVVTLQAMPTAPSTFGGWLGCDATPTPTSCQVTINAATEVTATFSFPPPNSVNVSLAGTGGGTVTAAPDANGDGISCPADCTGTYNVSSVVLLQATPDGSSTFVSWLGCDSNPTANSCQLTVTAGPGRDVTAQFDVIPRSLGVNLSGSGGGSVAAPADGLGDGIACPTDCDGVYADGALVTLQATASSSSAFIEWTGCDSNPTTDTCTVAMNSDRIVVAQFDVVERTLAVSLTGTGGGTVTAPSDFLGNGVACPSDCTGIYADGAVVTLQAVPDASSEFQGWVGCDSNPAPEFCTVTMTSDRLVSAQFETMLGLRPSVSVPTLGVWAVAALSGSLAIFGLLRVRRGRY